jgi:quinol monooxygenase YgiN
MADKKVTVVARFRAKSGLERQVADALSDLIQPTRKEPGCVNYDLHQSPEDKTLFLFYENWTSKRDLDQHLETPHLRNFLSKASDILAEPVEITLWDMTSHQEK